MIALITGFYSGSHFEKPAGDVRFCVVPQKNNSKLRKTNFSMDFSQIFRTRPNASECIQMHPSPSERIRTGPGRSQQLRKPQKTCKNLRKTCENFAKNFEKNFAKPLVFSEKNHPYRDLRLAGNCPNNFKHFKTKL